MVTLEDIQQQLKKLEELTTEEYYVSFYGDGSSVTKRIGYDNWYIHNFDINQLEFNLQELINQFQKEVLP